jgi:Secretion system C-terminal sorting domain
VVGAGGTILHTSDAGLHWVFEQSGVTTDLSSVVMYDDNLALASGDNGIILKTTNGGLAWVQPSPPAVESLQTYTYPEPSHGLVRIGHVLPLQQTATLVIADLTGRIVATDLNKKLQSAGSQSATFDGSRFPAGTYTYQLQTPRYRASGKFTLLK